VGEPELAGCQRRKHEPFQVGDREAPIGRIAHQHRHDLRERLGEAQLRRAPRCPPCPGREPPARLSQASPAAVALWARVSPLVDKALSENLDKGVRLSPGAWTSGDILWLIAIGGHPRAVPAFLRQLREHEFKDKAVKMRRRMPDGTRIVVDLHQPQSA
jgi:hypothetical protein